MTDLPPEVPQGPGPCPERTSPHEKVVAITVRMTPAQRDWLLKMAGHNFKSMNSYCLDLLGVHRIPDPGEPNVAPG